MLVKLTAKVDDRIMIFLNNCNYFNLLPMQGVGSVFTQLLNFGESGFDSESYSTVLIKISFIETTNMLYIRGLKLSFICGPHFNKKRALGPH